MGAITAIVLSIAALDSLNPSTVGPAVVLALGEQPVRRVALFAAGVFATSTVTGLVLVFAFGRTLVAQVAHPSAHTKHVVELVIGVGLLAAASVLWILRDRLRARIRRTSTPRGRSSIVLGAGIMAVELPTAFPYFGALLAVVGVKGVVREALLVVAYNIVFVAPLLCLIVVAAAGGTFRRRIATLLETVTAHGPVVLPIGVGCIGMALTAIGFSGL